MEFKLPEGFLLGTASAADQIEGGEVDSNWNDWYHKGKIKDGSNPANANDHWNRWKEDADIMAELGMQIARIGIEWPRVEPKEGIFDEAAIDRYREEIQYLQSKNIRVLVTIHHFGNPMWFENKGAFLKKENLDLFLDYGKYMAERLCDLVSDWITINEPNVYAMNGYFGGDWPPGRNNFGEYTTVLSNLAYCHIVLYQAIHIQREEMGFAENETFVSFANHLRKFEPKDRNNLFHKASCKFAHLCFQGAITDAMLLGKFTWPLKNTFHVQRGEFADFIGINYYSRSKISGLENGTAEKGPKNDLGWEIYPFGICEVANECYKKLQRPIWVTENGTCDNSDSFRALYIAHHLQAITQSKLPFERYYHWCFTDNFEWMEGESARFGLVHNDYKTQKRTIKNSAKFYSKVIKCGGVDEEISEKYLDSIKYHE